MNPLSDYDTQPPPSTGTTVPPSASPVHAGQLPATGAVLGFVLLLALVLVLAGLGLRVIARSVGR